MDTEFEDFLKGIKHFKKQNGYYQIDYQKVLNNNNEQTLNSFIARINEAVQLGYLDPHPNDFRRNVEIRYTDRVQSQELSTQLKFTLEGENFIDKSWFSWRKLINLFLQFLAAR